MSTRPRTAEYFPRMKRRGRGRRAEVQAPPQPVAYVHVLADMSRFSEAASRAGELVGDFIINAVDGFVAALREIAKTPVERIEGAYPNPHAGLDAAIAYRLRQADVRFRQAARHLEQR